MARHSRQQEECENLPGILISQVYVHAFQKLYEIYFKQPAGPEPSWVLRRLIFVPI